MDTDVLIEIDRGRIRLPDMVCYISSISLYEFIRGKADWKRAKKLMEKIYFILPLDNDVLLKATQIWRTLKAKGFLIDDRDLLIGATAIVHNLPLYTINKQHYHRLSEFGLKLW